MSSVSQSSSSTEGDVPCEFGGCPRTFKSRRAMKIHHTRTHGEQVPDYICAECETPFSSRRSDPQFCSPECANDSQRDYVTITCDCCYLEQERQRYEAERYESRYCGDRCKAIAQRFNYGEGDKIQQTTRPGTFKELVRHAYVYEGHSFEATCRIITHELDDDHSQEEIDDMVSELMSHEKNVRNRVWALRPEDLGLSPIGEVAQ